MSATNYPPSVFDRPQWHLLPDKNGVRQYANVSNRLELVRLSNTIVLAVAVPAELFTLMSDVLKVPVEAPCTLSIDWLNGWHVFSLMADGEAPQLHDLWAYTPGQLPSWMLDPAYRVR